MNTISVTQVSQLAEKYGIPTRWAEKILRLAFVLKAISEDNDLKDSLVFMGGSALNFGFFGESPPRLSFDLDFNYREPEKLTTPLDINAVQKTIYQTLQNLLRKLNYLDENVKHTSRFELGRYFIRYLTLSGDNDNFKLEVCYSRRIPLFRIEKSKEETVTPIKLLNDVLVRVSTIEELCGEKIAAFIKRNYSRDAYDIYNIAEAVKEGTINFKRLRKCVLVCILYQDIDPRDIDFDELFEKVSLDIYLQNALTNRNRISDQQFIQITKSSKAFIKKILSNYTKNESLFLDEFFKQAKFQPQLIDQEQEFHPRLSEQSEIHWILSKRSRP